MQKPKLQRWAVEQFALAGETGPAPVRAAFLQSLAGHGFVPPVRLHQAFIILTDGKELSPNEAFDLEEQSEQAIAGFAQEFFALPLALRRTRWQELMDFCLFAPQVARLQALEPGLDVDLSALTPEGHMVSQLGSYIAALFTCQPSQRPIERQILLPELARDLRPWVKAARRLRRKHRALAALEPELLGRLMSWRKRQRRLSKVRLHQAVSRAQAKNRFPAGWAVALGCLLVSCLMRFASFSPPSPSHVPDPYTRLEGIPKIRYVDPEAEEILDQMRRTQKNLDDSMRAKPGREVDVLREYLNRRLMDDSLKKVPGAKADTKAPRAGQSVSPPQKPRE